MATLYYYQNKLEKDLKHHVMINEQTWLEKEKMLVTRCLCISHTAFFALIGKVYNCTHTKKCFQVYTGINLSVCLSMYKILVILSRKLLLLTNKVRNKERN